MRSLFQFVRWLEVQVTALETQLLAGFVVAAFCLTFAQVVFRYVLDSPLVWSEELVLYLFVWIAMLGAAGSVRLRSHFSLTIFVARLPSNSATVVAALADVSIGVFALVLLVQGAHMTAAGFSEEATSLPVSMGWFYLALPAGAGLMLWHLVARAVLRPDKFSAAGGS